MLRTVIVVFLLLSAVQCSGASSNGTVDKCVQPNGFVKERCAPPGAGDECCGSQETCVGPLEMNAGVVAKYVCSADRTLTGTKAIKIVVIPFFFLLVDLFLIIFMVVKLDIKTNHVTKMGIAVIGLSWPFFMTSYWTFGVYASFLAIFVSFLSNTSGYPWWTYRLAWAMQMFQVIAIFGPTEAFHVPLYNQSRDGASPTQAMQGLLSLGQFGQMQCSSSYEQYFKVLPAEKQAFEADPDIEYFGYCSVGWLGFVQGMLMLQGILWIVLVLLSAPVLLRESSAASPLEGSSLKKEERGAWGHNDAADRRGDP